ncbi:MAG: hypothetical protein KatS3mg115_0819 [Candidatus Poribacteria bacterium]|nr:MAG: hypothetical protein KatS3mg115_0819 [Candidatus Poribacteria bacterium]
MERPKSAEPQSTELAPTELTLGELFAPIRRWWAMLSAGLVLGVVVAFLLAKFVATEVYRAQASLYPVEESGDSAGCSAVSAALGACWAWVPWAPQATRTA